MISKKKYFFRHSNSGKIGDQMSLAIKIIGYLIEAIKWSGDQMVKIDHGGQMSSELMAGDQMTGELMS
jgi:hypothetical protein